MTPEVENFLIDNYTSQLRSYSYIKLFGFFKKRYRQSHGINIPHPHFSGRRDITYRKRDILEGLLCSILYPIRDTYLHSMVFAGEANGSSRQWGSSHYDPNTGDRKSLCFYLDNIPTGSLEYEILRRFADRKNRQLANVGIPLALSIEGNDPPNTGVKLLLNISGDSNTNLFPIYIICNYLKEAYLFVTCVYRLNIECGLTEQEIVHVSD